MKGKTYTFFIASTPGKLQKLIIPAYVLHAVAVLALIGSITVVAAAGSYSRMLWKVGNYNALRHDQETLKKQYRQLQNTVDDTNQRLDSLQSLATEVAMTYGVLRYHPAAFDQSDDPSDAAGRFRPFRGAIHLFEEKRGDDCDLERRPAPDAGDELRGLDVHAFDLAGDGSHHRRLRRTPRSVQR